MVDKYEVGSPVLVVLDKAFNGEKVFIGSVMEAPLHHNSFFKVSNETKSEHYPKFTYVHHRSVFPVNM